jgi:hypothetical protein
METPSVVLAGPLVSIETVGSRPGIEGNGHSPERLIGAITLRTVS